MGAGIISGVDILLFLSQLQSHEVCAVKPPLCQTLDSRESSVAPFGTCACSESAGAATFATPSHVTPVLHPATDPTFCRLPHTLSSCFARNQFLVGQDLSRAHYLPISMPCGQYPSEVLPDHRYPPSPSYPWAHLDKSGDWVRFQPPCLFVEPQETQPSKTPPFVVASPHSSHSLNAHNNLYFHTYSPFIYSQFNPCSYYSSPTCSTEGTPVPSICCVSATPSHRDIVAEFTPLAHRSSPDREFASAQSFSCTPPRGSCGLKRTRSHLNLSLGASPGSSPARSPGSRTPNQQHRSSRHKAKPRSSCRANSPFHSPAFSDSRVRTPLTHELSFSKNKPPPLALPRQRLASREIPDVLTPDTPKFTPSSNHFKLILK